MRVRLLQEQLVREYRLALIVLLGAVGTVLLIACANVANLLFARGTTRQKEMAIRAALGARRRGLRGRCSRKASCCRSSAARSACCSALWGVAALVAASPIAVPRLHEVRVDRRRFSSQSPHPRSRAFCSASCPRCTRRALRPATRSRTRAGGRAAARRATRQMLVVAEVALSLVLLAGAGLLGRTLIALQHVDPGFVAEHAIGMQLSLQDTRYPKGSADQIAFYRRLVADTKAIPGVVASAITTTLPMSGSDIGVGFSIEGRPETSDPATRKSATYYGVSPDYFSAMGIRVVRGRAFTERDDEQAPNVIVIGETFAKRYWPNQDPIGRRITIGYNHTGPREVVGVVADVKDSSLSQRPPLEMYTPFPQTPWPFLAVAVRTQGDPDAMAASLRRVLAQIDPEQPASEVQDAQRIRRARDRHAALHGDAVRRVRLLALVLAGFGLFSVIAYSVAQRQREIGIRVALGAQPSAIRSLVLVSGALARRGRLDHRRGWRAGAHPRARLAALRRERQRPSHVWRGVGGAAVRVDRGGVSSRAPRDASGPYDRAEGGLRRTSLRITTASNEASGGKLRDGAMVTES